MGQAFLVRLTLFFLDGTRSETITDIVDAIALDRHLKNATMVELKADSVIDLQYTTLKEFPDDYPSET